MAQLLCSMSDTTTITTNVVPVTAEHALQQQDHEQNQSEGEQEPHDGDDDDGDGDGEATQGNEADEPPSPQSLASHKDEREVVAEPVEQQQHEQQQDHATECMSVVAVHSITLDMQF